MSKYVNPFTDFGFKKIFGDEQNKDILIAFLNELLPSHHQIQTLEFKQTEHLGAYDLDRKVIFDLYCENEKGDKFIVELQKAKQTFFKDRILFYSTFPIREQAEKGEWDFRLKAVYCIAILDFSFDEKDPEYLHHIQLKNQRNQVFYDKLMFVFVEVRKFNKLLQDLNNNIDRWLYFIKHLPNLDDLPVALQNNLFFPRILELAEVVKFDQTQRDAYENSLKYYWDLHAITSTAFNDGEQEGYDKGLDEGRLSGLKEGLEKGRQQGLKDGILKEKFATAQKMSEEGFSKEIILKLTGIDIDNFNQ
jgi:predicted transposase/invertase (TIGR01784 family)